MQFTPKQRMLNAYRGRFSDRYAVAPEFWYYYPAKVLGVDMIQFEREIPLWQALQTTFKKFDTEGWGVAFPDAQNPAMESTSHFQKSSGDWYQRESITRIGEKEFTAIQRYHPEEPSWVVQYPVTNEADVPVFLDALLNPETTYDFTKVNQAWRKVGEDYLLEFWLGVAFFDFVACSTMGFEKTLYYFLSEDPQVLERYQKRYIEFQIELIRKACRQTQYESFNIGCAYSCNSLIGPNLWRQWDKPYIKAVAEELHRHGKLLHIHFHGKSLETACDFAEIGIDCVCPFERPPGGDIDGLEGLKKVRQLLNNNGGGVTFNGNVHTVESLIRGTPENVRAEVRELQEAFANDPRLIIGTGDQVGKETPEENIQAMIEIAKKIPVPASQK